VLSLVVPTLNESENIADFLGESCATPSTKPCPAGTRSSWWTTTAPDRTWEIAARLAEGFPELRVVRRQNEGGLAVAVIRGWQVARGQILGTINADFQHPPDVLGRLLERREAPTWWWPRAMAMAAAWAIGDGPRASVPGAPRSIGRWCCPGLRARFGPAERLLPGAPRSHRRSRRSSRSGTRA
jgi:hypothetical protein